MGGASLTRRQMGCATPPHLARHQGSRTDLGLTEGAQFAATVWPRLEVAYKLSGCVSSLTR